jgi:hypothetical protein
MDALIESCGRYAEQRTTLYARAPIDQRARSYFAAELSPVVLTPVSFSNTRRRHSVDDRIHIP